MIDEIRNTRLKHQLPEISRLDIAIQPTFHPPSKGFGLDPRTMAKADNMMSDVCKMPCQMPANESAPARYPDSRHGLRPPANKREKPTWPMVDTAE